MTHLVNLGCKLNQYEGHCLLEYFKNKNPVKDRDLKIEGFSNGANVVIINTCVVTKEAERKSRKRIRQAINQRPKPLVIVSGCLAEQSTLAIDGVDLVLRGEERRFIVEGTFPNPKQTRYFLKIQDGCDSRCSYCIVPIVRGQHCSLPEEKIIQEAKHARDSGYPEIVLTGVNLGAYGKDIGTSLAELLSAMGEIGSLPRLRLSSLEPQFLSLDLIELFTRLPLCRHLHLPLQSADQKVLQIMNRIYDIEKIQIWMKVMLEKFPEFSFGADIIVGFVGEDQKAFKKTFDFIAAAPLSYLHVFPYSLRPGTAAWSMGDPVKQSEKKERVRLLRHLSQEKFFAFRRMFIGNEFMATAERREGEYFGLTDNYIRVKLNSVPKGNWVKIRLTKVTIDETWGEIV